MEGCTASGSPALSRGAQHSPAYPSTRSHGTPSTLPSLQGTSMRYQSLLAAAPAALCLALAAPPAVAQSDILLRLRAGSPEGDRFRTDSSGAFVAIGFVRDVGNSTG